MNYKIDIKKINDAMESDDIKYIKQVLDDLYIAYEILQSDYQQLYQDYRRK